jgi:hypothetical protein
MFLEELPLLRMLKKGVHAVGTRSIDGLSLQTNVDENGKLARTLRL